MLTFKDLDKETIGYIRPAKDDDRIFDEKANQRAEEERILDLLDEENRPPTQEEKRLLTRHKQRLPAKEPMLVKDCRLAGPMETRIGRNTEATSEEATPTRPRFPRTRASTRHRPNHCPARPVAEVDENGYNSAHHSWDGHPVPYIHDNGMIVDYPQNRKTSYAHSP